MPQSATLIDAPAGETVRHGSQIVTFAPYAGALVCEEIDYKKGYRALDQMDEGGKPSKSAYVPAKGTGTMTVQLKSATTRLQKGETGSFLDTDGSTSIFFIITELGVRYSSAEITKVQISIAEKLN